MKKMHGMMLAALIAAGFAAPAAMAQDHDHHDDQVATACSAATARNTCRPARCAMRTTCRRAGPTSRAANGTRATGFRPSSAIAST